MIEFYLDAKSGVAPYLQLVHQVRRAVKLGVLHEGDQLPTVREVVDPHRDQPEHGLQGLSRARARGAGRRPRGRRHLRDRTHQRGRPRAARADPPRPRAVARARSRRGARRRVHRGAVPRHLSDPDPRSVVSAAALTTVGLGRRYRRQWALEGCTLSIPRGHVVGLVGPNGAGKSTLLNLAAGLLAPTAARSRCSASSPACDAAQLARVGFVPQDASLYGRLRVEDHLRLGERCNPSWDASSAHARLAELGLSPRQRAGTLSGGQRAQLSLTIALAKRPELLLLDEPVASLDPLARREFLGLLMSTVAGHDVSIVLSSHLVSDVERVCDFVIVLVDSRVRVAGEIDELLSVHHRLVGTRSIDDVAPANQTVISASVTDRQRLLVVRSDGPVVEPGWVIESINLEDLVLAYMGQGAVRQEPPAVAASAP